mgnify:CR=1 FL=1
MLKKTVGLEKFTGVYASTQRVRAERRDVRKQKKAFQVCKNLVIEITNVLSCVYFRQAANYTREMQAALNITESLFYT